MRIWSLFPAVVCVSVLALAVQGPVNFSGTWVLDKSKSKLPQQTGGGGFPRGGGRGGGYPGGGRGGGFPGGGGRGGGYPGGGGGRRGSGGGGGEGREPVSRDLDTNLVIEQTAKELRLVRKFEVNGEERTTTQVFNLEGETSTNPVPMGRGEYKTRTSWEKNKLVTLGTQTVTNRNGQRDLPIKEEFSLSKDGKELTLKTTRTTARGKASSKMVYRKQ